MHTKLARACFDITVCLEPPENIRRTWKIRRDCAERGYTPDAVLAELDPREPDAAAHIRPQRPWADIAVRFAPVASPQALPGGTVPDGVPPGGDGTSLSAEILMRRACLAHSRPASVSRSARPGPSGPARAPSAAITPLKS